jgi:hypothetical protein
MLARRRSVGQGGMVLFVLLLLSLWPAWLTVAGAAKPAVPLFVTEGPILTMSFKDDADTTDGLDESVVTATAPTTTGQEDEKNEDTTVAIPGFSLLPTAFWRPQLLYSIRSQRPPLPRHVPALKSLQAALGYRPSSSSLGRSRSSRSESTTTTKTYDDDQNDSHNRILFPTWVEAVAKLEWKNGIQWQVQPSIHFARQSASLLVQAVRGTNYALLRFGSSSSSRGGVGGGPLAFLSEGKASYYHSPVPSASIASVRITPGWDREAHYVQFEAVTGGAGRTKLIFNCRRQRGTTASASSSASTATTTTTLAVQYQPDDRHLIRPEIDLATGHIIYQYVAKLRPFSSSARGAGATGVDTSGSFTATVDPIRSIEMTWVDPGWRGSWITDITVPLLLEPSSSSTIGQHALAPPRIRIRRFLQL